MKKTSILFLNILFSLTFAQNTFKVNYETIYQPNKLNYNGFQVPENQKIEIEKQIAERNKQPKQFVLYYNDGNSFFTSNSKINLSKQEQKTEFFRLKNKDGLFWFCDYIIEEFYGYYPMDNVTTEYTNETQTIENYTCKLALYNNGETISKVWYTEDIPISAGPYNYYKVPGLILKVENSKLTCYATSISKEFDKKNLRKMDPNLKIYEGKELEIKQIDGKEKMLGNMRRNAEQMMNENKNR